MECFFHYFGHFYDPLVTFALFYTFLAYFNLLQRKQCTIELIGPSGKIRICSLYRRRAIQTVSGIEPSCC